MKNPVSFAFKHSRAWLLTTCITLSLLLIVSLLATQVALFKNTLLTVLGDYRQSIANPYTEQNYTPDDGITDKKSALEAANDVNRRINEEGIVLLKNDGALPIPTPVSDSAVSSRPKISVFGKNSENLVYGGSGSGGKSAGGALGVCESLEKAGFDCNPLLKEFYSSKASGSGRPSAPAMGTELDGFATGETPLSAYPVTVKNSYSQYADAAVVVFSRIGGEGFDLPRTMKNTDGANSGDHYLQLDNNERALLKEVCSSFDKVIVIINSAAAMELGFLDDENHYAYHENIKGAVWMGNPGGAGAAALGKVLSGAVNPSGRLVDTYARNFKNDPTWANFGDNLTQNGHRYTVDSALTDAYFVDYEEGIYSGYRYYETAYAASPADKREQWYDDNVVFPFGYGLSYTSFSSEIIATSHEEGTVLSPDDEITVTVRVTNTGKTAGKQVVQLYYSAPYTAGGIEKPSVSLADFAKTDMLYPAGSASSDKKNYQDLQLTLKARDMASYDCFDLNGNGFKGWELEAGDYRLSLRGNAHDEIQSFTLNVPHVSAAAGVKNEAVLGENGFVYPVDEAGGSEIKNRFDEVSSHIETYLSRASFETTAPKAPTDADREVDAEFIDSLSASAYIGTGRNVDRNKPWYTAERPSYAQSTVSSKDIPQLYELRGKTYGDELWKQLLDNLTLAQMAELIGTGNFNTAAIDNILKPKTIDPDGPAGFTNFMTMVEGSATVYDTCFYACETLIGATFNKQLAAEMGNAVGNEALIGNERGGGRPYSGWYAPAVNIHRSPFSGRNFEYYSEDGVLSGKMGAEVVKAVQKKGVYTYVKHFALNDQETQRGGVCTWASEQAMREIYFKPFEIIVKEGGTRAMMSSFNRIGTVWAGGSYELLTEVLRNEWGFTGMVITDYNTYDHMPADQMIRAGGDLNLFQDKKPSVKGGMVTASHLAAMRRAAHNILYTVANSNAMNDLGPGARIVNRMPIWMVIMTVTDVAAVIGFGVWGFFSLHRAVKKQKENRPD